MSGTGDVDDLAGSEEARNSRGLTETSVLWGQSKIEKAVEGFFNGFLRLQQSSRPMAAGSPGP